jgi:hypothetical protein
VRAPSAPANGSDRAGVDGAHPNSRYSINDMETYRRRVDYGSGSVERETDELLEAMSRRSSRPIDAPHAEDTSGEMI